MSEVRVRFAPSPTGPLHIGGVRTALYNYLFAKKHHGTFVLRIEDTDQKRYVSNAEAYIINALDWCGIPFDEGPGKNEKFGPYRQSERKSLYRKYADELISNGKAYYAFDSAEQLDELRKEHEQQGKTFIYNWHNRSKGRLVNSLVLSEDEVQQRIQNGEDYVVRFKSFDDNPEARSTISFNDEIRGNIQIDRKVLDDKILFKSDGMPTYHLANIVDDYLMRISHVIRGEEWLPSLALHHLLYEAFGWEKPKFAHLPLILKPVGKGKLSKRDGDKMGFPVFPLAYEDPKTGEVSRGYREDGYLPEAVVNMLSFLGWNPGTEQEVFTLSELINSFDLSRVSKSGAKFSPEKAQWFNQQHLQLTPSSDLSKVFQKVLNEKGVQASKEYTVHVIELVKERAVFSSDLWELSSYFFVAPKTFDEKAKKKQWKESTPVLMKQLISLLLTFDENSSSQEIENGVKEWIHKQGVGFGKVMQPLRLSLVGSLKGPHLFDIISAVGIKESVQRIEYAIKTL